MGATLRDQHGEQAGMQESPPGASGTDCAHEQRAAPRYTPMIRAAKLVGGPGEFVCIVRDISSSGVRLRCFHPLPIDAEWSLELHHGERYALLYTRSTGEDISFRFRRSGIPVEQLIRDSCDFPRRQLRLGLAVPVTVRTLAGPAMAVTQNVSQQGCRMDCPMPLAISQPVVIEGLHPSGIRAKVRWRREGACGLVFDDTFSLSDFALNVARLQALRPSGA